MRIAYRGNFRPTHSTETHVAASLESLGHEVVRLQEDAVRWPSTYVVARECDLLLWTTTKDYADIWPRRDALRTLAQLADAGVPTVGFHLDLWWGLARAQQVHEEPFFRCSQVFTADGGHDELWVDAGVRHTWLPPAVYHEECALGTARPEFDADVVFVGSWQGHYHRESRHRHELIQQLRLHYGDRFVCWPRPGEPAVRGERLNDLYASARVVVGDSCLTGSIERYWSDRIPETLGRGGVLVHPHIPGFEQQFTSGVHLATFEPFDWDEMFARIDHLLTDTTARDAMRLTGHAHTREHHTYRNRMQALLGVMQGVRA